MKWGRPRPAPPGWGCGSWISFNPKKKRAHWCVLSLGPISLPKSPTHHAASPRFSHGSRNFITNQRLGTQENPRKIPQGFLEAFPIIFAVGLSPPFWFQPPHRLKKIIYKPGCGAGLGKAPVSRGFRGGGRNSHCTLARSMLCGGPRADYTFYIKNPRFLFQGAMAYMIPHRPPPKPEKKLCLKRWRVGGEGGKTKKKKCAYGWAGGGPARTSKFKGYVWKKCV